MISSRSTACQSLKVRLVSANRLLEGSFVLCPHLIFHAFESLLDHNSFITFQVLQFQTGCMDIRTGRRCRNIGKEGHSHHWALRVRFLLQIYIDRKLDSPWRADCSRNVNTGHVVVHNHLSHKQTQPSLDWSLWARGGCLCSDSHSPRPSPTDGLPDVVRV